jgi:uncharacterized delta-60 repeat protein
MASMTRHRRGSRFVPAALAAGLLLVVVAPPAAAAAGDLDPAFNRSGMVTTDFFGSEGDLAYAVAVQADGKIVAAGRSLGTTQDYDFALARYTANGGRDVTFDGDGRVLTGFGRGTATFNDQAYGLAIQADGRIVVAGEAWNGADFDFALARLNTNGSLDSTFGGGGKVLTDYGMSDHGRGIDIAAVDGQITVAGIVGTGTDYDIAVARYDTDGDLDPSFSGDGKKIVVYAGMNGIANGVAIDPANGRIVVAGTVSSPGVFDFALVRLKPGGQLIGKGQTDFGGAQDLGQAVVIQPNGRIVVAGLGNDDNFGLARYTPNGVLDPLFGVGGKVITDFGSDGAQAKAVAIQPADGKIVAAGERFSDVSGGDFAVARYLAG